ncbi:disabled homolog 2-interacting protein isoform X1, partial [Lates japonicus]
MYFSKDQFHYVKISLFAESPPERTGRRRSMPGSSSDKTTPAMEATSTAATPFRVTGFPKSRRLKALNKRAKSANLAALRKQTHRHNWGVDND